jgi:hypothetical protein
VSRVWAEVANCVYAAAQAVHVVMRRKVIGGEIRVHDREGRVNSVVRDKGVMQSRGGEYRT